jgi:hypothetical protein
MPGLDPGIHADERPRLHRMPEFSMDHRVKPGGDEGAGFSGIMRKAS